MAVVNDVAALRARVAETLNVREDEIAVGSNRHPRNVFARHALAWLLYRRGFSLVESARLVGYKDHTSVMGAIAKLERAPESLRARLLADTEGVPPVALPVHRTARTALRTDTPIAQPASPNTLLPMPWATMKHMKRLSSRQRLWLGQKSRADATSPLDALRAHGVPREDQIDDEGRLIDP